MLPFAFSTRAFSGSFAEKNSVQVDCGSDFISGIRFSRFSYSFCLRASPGPNSSLRKIAHCSLAANIAHEKGGQDAADREQCGCCFLYVLCAAGSLSFGG